MQIGTDSEELLGIVNELSGKQCDTRWAGTTELRDYTPRTWYCSILSQLPKQLYIYYIVQLPAFPSLSL